MIMIVNNRSPQMCQELKLTNLTSVFSVYWAEVFELVLLGSEFWHVFESFKEKVL